MFSVIDNGEIVFVIRNTQQNKEILIAQKTSQQKISCHRSANSNFDNQKIFLNRKKQYQKCMYGSVNIFGSIH